MKKIFAASLLVCLGPASLAAQEEPPGISLLPGSVTVAADVVTRFVFRGVDVVDATTIQPWATLSLGNSGVSVTAWGSFAATDRDRVVPYSTTLTRGGADEIDLTASLARSAGPLSLGAGYVRYMYPADQQDYATQEVYGSVGVPSAPFAPSLSVYYDFDHGPDSGDTDAVKGLYASLGAARTFPVGVPLDVGVSLGYTDQEALRADGGLNDFNVAVGTSIPFRGLTLAPSLAYTHVYSGSAYAADGDDVVWARLQLRFAR